jgi:hypothetical protein
MTHEEIQKKAKKRVKDKKDFFVTATTFGFISLILLITAFIFPFPMMVRFWILFPILVFGFVLVTMYMSIFGLPGSKMFSAEWEEAETRHEMERLYRQQGLSLPSNEELSEEERLELKELERLQQKWRDREDFV